MRADVTRWAGIADIVKASADDVEVLYPGEAPDVVAARWQALGPAVAIVTLGAAGVVAVTRDGTVRLPAPPTTVVDTVAAGDTFTAGLLAHLHEAGLLGGRLSVTPEQLHAALEYAMRAAAVTCGRVGADPPYRHEV
jgi:fructokinase